MKEFRNVRQFLVTIEYSNDADSLWSLDITKTNAKIPYEFVREIKSFEIGEIMMNALKEVDTVAYVRFASVYRDFQDIKDFSEEINSLNKEKPKKKKSKK